MADRMIADRELVGKTRGEVLEMLGHPEPDSAGNAHFLSFFLGPERSVFGVDTESLRIRFGPDGRVTECLIGGN